MTAKRCRYCGKEFTPDPRVGHRQKACSAPCQKLRKKENLKDFIRRYPSYWRDRYPEVKQWRQQHPDYQRRWRQAKKKRRSPGEIQVERLTKAIEFTEKTSFFLREIQTEILLKGPAIGSFYSARP